MRVQKPDASGFGPLTAENGREWQTLRVEKEKTRVVFA